MLGPVGAGGDPAAEGLDLRRGERRALGWHADVGIRRGDPRDDRAGRRISGHDRPLAAVERGGGRRSTVEPQARLLVVGAMARIASSREQWLNVALEVDLGSPRRDHGHGESDEHGQMELARGMIRHRA